MADRVVYDLTVPLQNLNHIIVMDNNFSSPALFQKLEAVGIYALGTIRSSRKNYPRVLRKLSKLKGKDKFKAEEIEKHTNSFTVTNPDLVICHLDSNVKLEMELIISKGRGYVPAEEHKLKDAPAGTIPVDAIFTPIKNVKYSIENTRVEQKTDYEKLIVDIATDGTIHPEEAIKEAAKIMIQHLMLISDERITFDTPSEVQEEAVDEEVLHMRKMLKTPLEDLDLSVRAYNCLKAAKIDSLAALVRFDTGELLKFRNFGKKSLMEIEQVINEKGLHFGMDLSKYKLEQE